MRRARRERAKALGMLIAVLGTAAGGPAEAGTGTPPPASTQPLPERARAVLEAHCAECRGEGNGVDLDAVADNPRLVVAKRPDASRIYQRLLAENSGQPDPTAADIETVRDWIESLPAREEGCRDRTPITQEDIENHVDAWSEAVSSSEAADTRFVSLVHLWNACASPASLREFRDAIAILLAAIARRREPVEVETLGDASALLVIRLYELSLPAADWERLAEEAPLAPSADAIPADWLAARILSGVKNPSGNSNPAFDVRFDGAGDLAVRALARSWNKDVDLVRAAAESGVTPRAFAETLAEVSGGELYTAQRLIHGALSRVDWDRLSRVLDGEALEDTQTKRVLPDTEIDVLLWTDKPRYWPRDLVTINASVSQACHLTLINVDREGKAIVLFPNDIEQDNLVAPGVTIRVPGRDAAYQLRFDRSGEEEIVAICQRESRHPAGIAYDYEKQRFEILGDWRTFLRTAPEREKEIRARESAEAARRKRRARTPPAAEPPAIAPSGPPIEGRAAITVVIDPAGTANE